MKEDKSTFTINFITYSLMLSLAGVLAYAVDSNTDVLDAADRQNIDFSRFSRAGYIIPGQYQMEIRVNGQDISPLTFQIAFLEPPFSDPDNERPLLEPCLAPEIVSRMGLAEASQEGVTYWDNGQCADLRQLSGMEIYPNLAEGMLYINMSQVWLEYSDVSWLPPSRWDNGIPELLFDYNINGTVDKPHQGKQSQSLNYNGAMGANFGAWRLRADYQGNLNHTTGSAQGTDSQFTWSRFYMYRAISCWRVNLTLGENYINSGIFSSWRYTDASLESDDRMLPPKLRGYASQVSRITDTNARVVISRRGRILYDSTVPADPFTTQDPDSSVHGHPGVEVIEQDGQKKMFQVDMVYVPYLTRPDQVRYKLVSGRSCTYEHTMEDPVLAVGGASWGISNTWSFYGGSIVVGDYDALVVGLGRDLSKFDTVFADVAQFVAHIPGYDTKQGKSWCLSYPRRLDEVNTDITFVGYRLSEHNYMTMDQYLNTRYRNDSTGREKELYTVTLNKNSEGWKASVSLQYSRQTYWDHRTSDYYALSVNHYFNAFSLKNIVLGIFTSCSKYLNRDNDSAFVRLSVPRGTGTASCNGSMNNDRYTNTMGHSDTLDNGLSSYDLNAGVNSGGGQPPQRQMSAYYNHSGSSTNLSASFSAVENGYSSFGMSTSGGATVTMKGAALHAGGMNGGIRPLVDTDGVGGAPVDGGRVYTNRWGIGVVTDVSSYYRNTTSVDLNKLPEDMEATRSVAELALTEGATGYRELEVLKGSRLFVVSWMPDNSYPSFGASMTNAKGRELGMAADSGLAWLSRVNPGETPNVDWDGRTQCVVDTPVHPDPA